MDVGENSGANELTEDPDVVRRKEKMHAALDKRKDDRIESVQQKKTVDSERISKQKTYDHFTAHFKEECDAIQEKLKSQNFDVGDRVQVANHFDNLSRSFEKLVKFLNDSTVFLRPFQLEQAQKTLNQIQIDIMNKKQNMMPKKKFAFKAKKKIEPTAKEKSSEVPLAAAKKFEFAANQCDISDKSKEMLVVDGDKINQRDLSLSKLQSCHLELRGYPGTVHLSDISDCLILCGPVSGSVFVENCTKTKIIAGCQQLRVHNTTDTDFYLHVTSRAIIEDTTRVRFAPYNWNYNNLNIDFMKSGLSRETNNWNKVDDFNWLAMDTPSPNWSVLPEIDRQNAWPAAE